jgi:uncharacterized protein
VVFGVLQDGLVHISAMSHKFIKDPREVVKAGDVVKVKVQEVDVKRKRIALTMRLNDDVRQKPDAGVSVQNMSKGDRKVMQRQPEAQGAMAAALAGLKLRK